VCVCDLRVCVRRACVCARRACVSVCMCVVKHSKSDLEFGIDTCTHLRTHTPYLLKVQACERRVNI
jgi:hypothetical protein